MTRRRALPLVLVGVAVAAAAASCTDTYLYDQRREDQLPVDRTVSMEGEFCTPATNEVVRPIKILIAMDASQSMRVTDPDGTRAQAVVDLLDSLPQEKEVSIVVMLFAGSTTAFLTRTGLQQFEAITDFTPADRQLLRQRILNFATPGNAANRDSTDFVKPLSDIYALMNRDLSNTRLMMQGDASRPRYSVIFLSDGEPTDNQDLELLCGDAVRRIRQLKDLADDVRFNTVHVFVPATPIASSFCDFDGGVSLPAGGSACQLPTLPSGTCPLLIVSQNAERLKQMAALGGGDFRDFRNNEPVNFVGFRFGQVRRAFVFDKLVAANFSAPPESPLDKADTDSDGLLDADEARERTLPWVADTDTDGFSDGVEVHFRGRGASFTPNQRPLRDGGGLDPGCPPELRGVDSDCDGLLDCDEQIIGTNSQRIDSDDDGIPDSVEWQMGTQPSSKDLDQDPDNDGLPNGQEVSLHTDPALADSEQLSTMGYRYQVVRKGALDADGRQCFSFRVDNIALANTLPDTRDAGNPDGGAPLYRRGAGYNDVFLSVSMRPGDDPTGHTLMKVFRSGATRFPVGGIRSPVDGVIHVNASDLVSACPARQ